MWRIGGTATLGMQLHTVTISSLTRSLLFNVKGKIEAASCYDDCHLQPLNVPSCSDGS